MSENTERSILDLVGRWDGVGVVVRHDVPTGTWMFVALHDDALGRPTGGCRMKVYDAPEDGLRDALRLASGMTRKWAAVDLPFGGGKAVLAIPRPMAGEERRGLLRRFGALLDSLRGSFATGEDLGTTPDDMHFLGTVTDWVMGSDPVTGAPVDPGPWTALGVFHGIRAALEARTGSPALAGRSVLIQGVGDVGSPLADLVAGDGGRVLLADLDEGRARRRAAELGGEVVPAREVVGAECDVYAPCAVGGVLSSVSIPRLRCRIVAGSANNQLERVDDAERLKGQGVLYAPDYLINAGGAVALGSMMLGVLDEAELRQRVQGIGSTLSGVFDEAQERGDSPLVAAERRVDAVLARARREGVGRDSVAGGR